MEKFENKKNVLIVVIGVLLIGFSSLMMFKGLPEKKKNNNGEEKREQNDVVVETFSLSFLKLNENKDNFIYSPLSIKYALSMLNEGAKGNTKDEITKVIGDNTITKYNNIKDVLSLANSIFIRDSYKGKVKDNYIDTLNDKYNAELFYDEFKNAQKINSWIEEKTFGIIKDMLSDDSVSDPDVKIILVNALAIDMEWLDKFENENTHSAKFTREDKELDVAMMNKTMDSEYVKYVSNDEVKAVVLPLREYEGVNLEFIAVLPEENVHDYVTSENFDSKLENVLNSLSTDTNKEVNISIPRFEFETKYSLVANLYTLGMHDVFNSELSDLTDIADVRDEGKNLYVSEVLHDAKIEFSERGIKAAAATVIYMKDNAMPIEEPKEQVNLNFDKPFIFMIRDRDTNEVWFVGTVYEPVLWENAKDNYKSE